MWKLRMYRNRLSEFTEDKPVLRSFGTLMSIIAYGAFLVSCVWYGGALIRWTLTKYPLAIWVFIPAVVVYCLWFLSWCLQPWLAPEKFDD